MARQSPHTLTAAVTAMALLQLLLVTAAAGQDNIEWVRGTLENPDFPWTLRSNDRVHLYTKDDSFAQRHSRMLLRSATDAIDDALEFIGESEYEESLTVFYVDSREEMQELVGNPVTGYAVWTESCVFLACNPKWRSFDTHEIAHVLSINFWGFPPEESRWMLEGVPILVDGWCAQYTIDEIALHLLRAGLLPRIGELVVDFRSLGEVRTGVYAASFVGYIREMYGSAAVKKMWTEGVDALAESLNTSLQELESRWQESLSRAATRDIEVNWERINEQGCG